MGKTVSKYILEIKFKPDSRILDKRGEIAESLLKEQFTDWNIQENRIDFSKKGNEEFGAYFSYRGLGVYSSYPNKLPFFKRNVKDFINSAWEYFESDTILRIGIRGIYLTEADKYQATFDKYKSTLFTVDNTLLEKFGGKLYDFAVPMNFTDGKDYFHVNTGPMYREQSEAIFDKIKDLPKFGVYVDVDFFKKDFLSIVKKEEVQAFIEKGLKKTEEINDLIQGMTV